MAARDINFCYNLIVASARCLGKQSPTFKEVLIHLRTSHKKVNKKIPQIKILKKAYRQFRKAGPQFPTPYSRR